MAISTLFFLLTLFFHPIQLALGNNITLNSTLSTDDNDLVWLSSSGEFAFGFRQINDSDTNQNQNIFLVAIWYHNIPDKFGGCQPDFSLGCGADEAGSRDRLEEENVGRRNYPFLMEDQRQRKGYPNGAKVEDPAKPILIGSLVGSLVINSVFLASVILLLLLKPKKIPQASSVLESNLYSFPYETLKQYPQDFCEELGWGSFSIVYKGTLNSGSDQFVAVKKLNRLAIEREKEFKTELNAIGKTSHKNLVRLIGFCDEGTHRLLVCNGTLADILFGQVQPNWNLRVTIALGIAKGLVYLHEECGTPIIHCDIKPQNVLIDEYFTPISC